MDQPPRPATAPPGRRYAALDGVRGLAALMVALSHFCLAFQPALLGGGPAVSHFPASLKLSQTALIVLVNPELGVAIFFVLSGFVLAASIAGRPTPFAELVVRRWVRLAIPVLGTSAIVWVLAACHAFWTIQAGAYAKSTWLSGSYLWVGFMPNDPLTMVWQSTVDIFLRGRSMYNPALWTMPTEFWGSMGLFAGYCGLAWLLRLRGAGVVLAAIAAGLFWNTVYFGFPFGVLLFELRRWLVGLPAPVRARLDTCAPPLGFALLVVGVLLGGHPYSIDMAAHGPYARLLIALGPLFDNFVLLAHRIGAVCLVSAALLWRPFAAFLTMRACQYLGRISFMLYLVHVPILCSLISWALLRLEPLLGYNTATAVLLPVFLASVFAMAEVTTRAFDLPAIGLSRRAGAAAGSLLRRLGSRAARLGPAPGV